VSTSRPFSSARYRGEIAEPYAAPEAIAALLDVRKFIAGPGAEVLFQGRNTLVALRLPLGSGRFADVVVKEFGIRGAEKARSLVRASKAARAWRGARALIEANAGTPFPVAFLERRHHGLVVESYFIAERVEGAQEVRDVFRTLPAGRLEPLLSALGRELAALHAHGILHRDLSDGNVLIDESSGTVRFLFLDTNRVRVVRSLGPLRRAKNLVRLGVPPECRRTFLEWYAEARGRRLSPLFFAWYKVSKSGFSTWIRFKKTLRLKKIARRLGLQ
jgi:hypothetical protein